MRTVNDSAPPPQTGRTAIPLGGLAILAAHASLVVLLAIRWPLLALTAGAVIVWPVASDFFAGLFSDHVVYMLYKDDEVIYVGETDDVYRRMYQHTDGIEHTWWRDIHGYNIARHCWSDRQSKRIERRLIAVVNRCAEKSWCGKLRNEIWDDAHTELATRLTLWWWKFWYLYASHIADCRLFHTTNRTFYCRSIPAKPRSDSDPEDQERWRGGEPRAEPRAEATYQRQERSTANHGVTILALPPVSSYADRNEPDRNDPSPSRREGGARSAQNRNAQDVTAASEQTTLSTRVRDAHTRRAEAIRAWAAEATTGHKTSPTDPEPAPGRRGRTNAERQKAYRERQKAKRQQQPHSPTADQPDQQAPQGRGMQGGGE